MNNGQIWAAVVRGGMTCDEEYGRCLSIIFAGSYDKVKAWYGRQSKMDKFDPDYVWTEHGGRLPSQSELQEKPVSFIGSEVWLELDNGNPFPDCRDLKRPIWRVFETDLAIECRVLGESLYFAEAWNLAQTYAMQQPGDCRLRLPERFYRPASEKRRAETLEGQEIAMPKNLPDGLDWA
ncbi:MAG: hypothetical protein GF349_00845 [Candidatus Magasanikbacteria bacterium]|nr:hypothetical protein [Candidatus Magasanikbacteria bacterium]